MEKQQPEIQIKASDENLKGNYSNFTQISHSKEEFVLDFCLVHPPVGQMVGRIITSPGHIKRIMTAIEKNIEKYEAKFGEIEEAKEPKAGSNIGFK